MENVLLDRHCIDARAHGDVQRQCAQDRPVRRQLLVRPLGHQGAGALVGELAGLPALAQMADEAGIDFMLPIGRWKGYGGDTDFHGSTLETITWAAGLLAATKRITVFGTVHAPLFHPLIAAKEFVTADHIGEGRFGLNIVAGWNEGEFEMFGVTQREHEARYDYAQEWIDVVKRAWSEPGDFDFEGQFLKLKGVRAKPKPYGGHAAADHERRLVGHRAGLRAAQLRCVLHRDRGLAHLARGQRQEGRGGQARGAGLRPRDRGLHRRPGDLPPDAEGGRGVLPLRQHRERRLGRGRPHAGEQEHHAADDSAGGIRREAPVFRRQGDRRLSVRRHARPRGRGARNISRAGMRGIAVSFVNYLNELPYFCDEVLPRLVRLGARSRVPASHVS